MNDESLFFPNWSYVFTRIASILLYSSIHVDRARQGFQGRLVDGTLREPNTKAALCIFKLALDQETGPWGLAVEKPVAEGAQGRDGSGLPV